MRAAVVRTVDVVPFWERQGFTRTGEVRPYRYGDLVSESVILEKSL